MKQSMWPILQTGEIQEQGSSIIIRLTEGQGGILLWCSKKRQIVGYLCFFKFGEKARDEFFNRNNLVDTVSILATEDKAVVNIPEVRI